MTEDVFILIVDDNEENLRIVSNYIKEMNYKIALAMDAENAFNILKQNKIDLILLDIMMPGIDGYQMCSRLKENPETADIPVIFLTAKSDTEDIIKGFAVGGVDYVSKPFRKEELLARVNSHIKLKLARDFLLKCETDARESRDQFMKVLLGLSKIIGKHRQPKL